MLFLFPGTYLLSTLVAGSPSICETRVTQPLHLSRSCCALRYPSPCPNNMVLKMKVCSIEEKSPKKVIVLSMEKKNRSKTLVKIKELANSVVS